MEEKLKEFLKNLYWLGHDGFLLKGKKIVYFDPYQIPSGLPEADVILITHPHYDHLSKEDIKKIEKDDTIIILPKGSERIGNVRYLKPEEETEVSGIKIKGVPAYNINKNFHPKRNRWLGYIMEINGVKIYHAGDTDNIPEMKDYKCDIALLPVSGTYVMTSDEAADAALKINPEVVIPMHYGLFIGSKQDAENLKNRLSGKIEVVIPERFVG